ncbi:hypothetical protein QVD99_008150 [Batrachochytrium dendrobatidis]|nr:hypothetical protein O5D80_004697 [Batrachochytrium dendrobatidis]KAK5665318.1 hypothetical protein QVD99_008150 [Batrachochytrium dendrobatidis]
MAPVRVTSKSRLPEYLLDSPLSKLLVSSSPTTTQLPLFAQLTSSHLQSDLANHSANTTHTADHPNPAASRNDVSTMSASDRTPSSSHQQHVYSQIQPLSDNPAKKLPSFGLQSYALPSSWNPKDKGSILDLSNNNVRVSYQGSGKSDADAASVRANTFIPPQTGIYYFEIAVTSKGRDGYIGIGFSTSTFELSRLPGWDDLSWGYHGDDGNIFSGAGSGKSYGPTYTTGDIVGCCINFMNMTALFTKNGIMLGVAFQNILRDKKPGLKLYPSIGLRTPGEVIEANFGQRPFKFDIVQYCREERIKFKSTLNGISLSSLTCAGTASTDANMHNVLGRPLCESKIIDNVVLSYLIHHGYSQAATSFYTSAFGNCDLDNQSQMNLEALSSESGSLANQFPGKKSMHIRKDIQLLIIQGKIESAIAKITQHYSDMLKENEIVRFQLDCLKFINISAGFDFDSNQGQDCKDVDAMDVDEGQTDKVNPTDGLADALPDQWMILIEFGQKMNQMYGSNASESIQNALQELFSLICYPDPHKSPVSYMLDISARQTVASNVNDAMLSMESLPVIPILDTLVRQIKLTHSLLVKEDVGAASFCDPERDYMS